MRYVNLTVGAGASVRSSAVGVGHEGIEILGGGRDVIHRANRRARISVASDVVGRVTVRVDGALLPYDSRRRGAHTRCSVAAQAGAAFDDAPARI